jgi:hypothetical protein
VLGTGCLLGVLQIQPGPEGTQHDHRTIVLRRSCHSLLRFAQDRHYLNRFQLSVTTLIEGTGNPPTQKWTVCSGLQTAENSQWFMACMLK